MLNILLDMLDRYVKKLSWGREGGLPVGWSPYLLGIGIVPYTPLSVVYLLRDMSLSIKLYVSYAHTCVVTLSLVL